jgi:pyridoxine 5-phosphate synthase
MKILPQSAEAIDAPLNFEMAATSEMVAIALKTKAECCLYCSLNAAAEVTTEGGLAVVGQEDRLADILAPLKAAGIRLSLFIEANPADIDAAKQIGADIVELHTGLYCHDVAGREAN